MSQEPAHKRGILSLLCINAFIFLVLSYIFCCCQANDHLSWKFLRTAFSTSSFLICAKEVFFFEKQWKHGFSFKYSLKDHFMFTVFVLVPGVVAAISDHHKMKENLQKAVLISVGVIAIFRTKLHRNKVDVVRSLERAHYAVGPGLAMAFASFLENAINGKHGSPVFADAIRQYRRREGILQEEDSRDWILNKVIIMFHEAKEARGSVQDILSKQKKEQEVSGQANFRLCFEKVKHEFELNGQPRVSHLEMLKLFDGNARGYVVIAENRPLNTLYSMRDQEIISEEIFKNQFDVYKNELRRILDETDGCGGNIEFFHYKDSRRLRDFGGAVIAKVNSMARENINAISLSRDVCIPMAVSSCNIDPCDSLRTFNNLEGVEIHMRGVHGCSSPPSLVHVQTNYDSDTLKI